MTGASPGFKQVEFLTITSFSIMPDCFLDFEVRSRLDIKSGSSRYSRHPSTLPLMLAYKTAEGRKLWKLPNFDVKYPACPSDLAALVADQSVTFHAHNAAFEIYIWGNICVDKWGWPAIPLDRWRCTAARAAACNQPRDLAVLCDRLQVLSDAVKDPRGKFLIKQLCVPQKALKTYKKKGEVNTNSEKYLAEQGVPTFSGKQEGRQYFWDNDPAAIKEFGEYCLQDIVAEEAAHHKLPDLPEIEQRMWLLDRKINMRGLPVDLELCKGAVDVYQAEVAVYDAEIAKLCRDELAEEKEQVETCSQRERIVKWLNRRCNFGPTLDKEAIEEWMRQHEQGKWLNGGWHVEPEVADKIKRVLELRRDAGGTAVAKYEAALKFVEQDNRVREQLLYYGAMGTGRWAGKGLQPHNMKRTKTPDEVYISAIKTGRREVVEPIASLGEYDVLGLLKACVRGAICAPPGRKLVVSDFAGIEARVLNWIVSNEAKLDLFRKNQDVYIDTAANAVYECQISDIADWNDQKGKYVIKDDHTEKRVIGKECELGLGYGMGWVKFQDTVRKKTGLKLQDQFAEEVVGKWRTANYLVTEFWGRIEQAVKAVLAARLRRKRLRASIDGRVFVYWDPREYLCIELPSGRVLRYFKMRRNKEDGQLEYLDGGKKQKHSAWTYTYGGKLCENVIQAAARDLLVHALLLADSLGLYVIGHVHDEIICEADEDDMQALDTLHVCMQDVPAWADGLPLAAESYEARRYTK